MFPFDVILFDVGGVLLTCWDHKERAAAMEHFDLDRAAFEARHLAPNDAWERDVIPVKFIWTRPCSMSRAIFPLRTLWRLC